MPNPPGGQAPYPEVDQQADYPRLEEQVLEYWAKDGTFAASVEARPGGANEFVFYDGPPFANGLPHYGHLLTGFVKDAVPRYQTMRGRRVERRFGWDCHGLPAEMEAEKELEVSGRAGIVEYGIDHFNDYCRALVQRTTDAWERYVTRQARWVDFANDYKTMDLSYMESVMWAFKALWDKGLLYEGERVLPYCWECETPLSNFETRQDDAYRPRQDPAVTVVFTLDADDSGTQRRRDRRAPAGAGVDDDTVDPAVEPGPRRRARHRATPSTSSWARPTVDRRRSRRGLPRAPRRRRAPGAVHGRRAGGPHLPAPVPVLRRPARRLPGAGGRLRRHRRGHRRRPPGTGFRRGGLRRLPARRASPSCARSTTGPGSRARSRPTPAQLVFDANRAITADLKAAGALVEAKSYAHSYPHCWRTDTPLIYKAVSSWFVKVTAVKDRMLELNQEIDWVPAHVRDGAFGKWLEGARDWSISRNRFWGSPIPVWKSDDPRYPRIDVYGSLDELERDFGVRLTDLHRPAIDELVRPNPDDPTGRSTMRRVTDVLDCWFESGSMPFAQVHYPFERAEWFESHFPADFIVEYVGQTRGWFYTLHVLATALFDRPPFRHCVAHGIVLGDDGRKMSKRLGNYPEPDMVFDMWGADAMRWFLLSSPILRGQDLVVHAKGIEEVRRQVLNPIWNAWYFLSLYANVDGIRGRSRTDATGVLDRYILAKTASLVDDVTASMDAYDLFAACAAITRFLDALNNWYIRRSRDRFWRARDGSPEVEADKADAYDTLSTVLATLCKVSAPLLPLLTESVYRGLDRGAKRPPGGLARPGRAPRRPRARRGHGHRARRVLGRACGAQGQRPAGPPPVAAPHRRHGAPGTAPALRRAHRGRGQRQRGRAHRRGGGSGRPGPHPRARRPRPPPGPRHPTGHRRGACRRLAAHRRRRRGRERAPRARGVRAGPAPSQRRRRSHPPRRRGGGHPRHHRRRRPRVRGPGARRGPTRPSRAT